MMEDGTTQTLQAGLDVLGWFWLASQPHDKMPGHLTFNPRDGATLELISRHPNEQVNLEFNDEDGNGVRILGEAPPAQEFTLLGCHSYEATESFISRFLYKSSAVLQGKQFEEGQSLDFAAVDLNLRHLERWVGKSSFGLEPASGGNTLVRVQPSKATSKIDRVGELILTTSCVEHAVSSGSFGGSYSIKDSCSFNLRFDELQSIQAITRKCHDLQNLVTIGSGSLAAIDSVHLFSDNTCQSPIRLYSRWVGADIPWKALSLLFSYDDIGGVDGVAKWLCVSDKYRHVVERLTAKWVVSHSVVNYRFDDAYIAAETLLRTRLGKKQSKNLSLARDISRLAEEAGEALQFLVPDVKTWAQKIVSIRNSEEIHINPPLDSSDGSTLYFLAESLYYTVVIHLLKECGIRDEVIASLRNHEEFKRLARGLKRCLRR